MKRLNRPIAFLMCLLMLASFVPQISFAADPPPNPKFFLVGDSIVAAGGAGGSTGTQGWGAVLAQYFDGVTVVNNAIAGRSAKQFIAEGRLTSTVNAVNPGDVVLIQWGHNDACYARSARYAPVGDMNTAGTYQNYIKQHVDAIREKGGIPVLITVPATHNNSLWYGPVYGPDGPNPNNPDNDPAREAMLNGPSSEAMFYDAETGRFLPSFPKYADGSREVAAALDVPLIDLNKLTMDYFNSLPNKAEGILYSDGVHLAAAGANAVAEIVAKNMVTNKIPGYEYVKPTVALSTAYKFDIGGETEGYTPITVDSSYSPLKGYGWEMNDVYSTLEKTAQTNEDPLKQSYISGGIKGEGTTTDTTRRTFTYPTFLVDLPVGIYDVKVTIGRETGNYNAGAMIEGVVNGVTWCTWTHDGNPDKTSAITRTAGTYQETVFRAAVWDGQLTIELASWEGNTNAISMACGIEITPVAPKAAGAKPRLHITGDSTAAAYNTNQVGYGVKVPDYFSDMDVYNGAMGGYGAVSYIEMGALNAVLVGNIVLDTRNGINGGRDNVATPGVATGDYMFIEWGHNDAYVGGRGLRYADPAEGGAFEKALQRFIDGAKAFGATPIILTPVTSRSGGVTSSQWQTRLKAVAASSKVTLLDLSDSFHAHMQTLTSEQQNALYADGTHLNGTGADLAAGFIARLAAESGGEFAKYSVFYSAPLLTEYKFDLGGTAEGFIPITPTSAYSKQKGYGWQTNDVYSTLKTTVQENAEPLRQSYISGDIKGEGENAPQDVNGTGETRQYTYPTFVVDLPVGIYDVKVTVGRETGSYNSGAIIEGVMNAVPWCNYPTDGNTDNFRASAARTAGTYVANNFRVAVWDGQLTVELASFEGNANAISMACGIEITPVDSREAGAKPAVHIVGDSTAAQGGGGGTSVGYGTRLPNFFTDDVEFNNRAVSGLASRTYIGGGNLNTLLTTHVKPGDYVFIDWGHNDFSRERTGRYADPSPGGVFERAMQRYVDAVRAFGATPIILAPVNQYYNGDPTRIGASGYNRYTKEWIGVSFVDWRARERDISERDGVTFLDLTPIMADYIQGLGFDATATLFYDGTHLSSAGADWAASNYSRLLAKTDSTLAPYSIYYSAEPEPQSWKFDFGSGTVASGYVGIGTGAYSADSGYGWSSSAVTAVDRGAGDPVKSDFVQVDASGTEFRIDLPNGDYRVTVISGDATASATVGYRVEDNNKMSGPGWGDSSADTTLWNKTVAVSAGTYNENTFDVALFDGQMTFTFLGTDNKVNAIAIEELPARQAGEIRSLFVIGDSLADGYASALYPQRGWGQTLQQFFDQDQVQVKNFGIGARTGLRNRQEGRLNAVLLQIRPGDYAIFNFGFNEKTTGSTASFQNELLYFIEGVKQRGGIPVLVSSTYSYRGNGATDDAALINMANAMRTVASSNDTLFIDNYAATKSFVRDSLAAKGATRPDAFYLVYQAGIFEGKSAQADYVHLQEYGAAKTAELFAYALADADETIADATIERDAAGIPDGVFAPYAVASTPTTVTLTWLEAAGADYYVVCSSVNDGDWTEIASVDYPKYIASVNAANTYEFKVIAVNGAGECGSDSYYEYPETRNAAALTALVTECRAIDAEYYTASSANSLKAALYSAATALSGNGIQEDIDASLAGLTAAKNALVSNINGAVKFDFGSGLTASGYIPVAADTAYSAQQRYGWLDTSIVSDGATAYADYLLGDWATGVTSRESEADVSPAFRVDVPNGVYRVTTYQFDSSMSTCGHILVNGKVKTTQNASANTLNQTTFNVAVTEGVLLFELVGFLPRLNGIDIAQIGGDVPLNMDTPVTKTALAAVLAEAKAIDGAEYSAATYAVLADAIAKAELALADDAATQEEVDAALAALNAALSGLVIKFVPGVVTHMFEDFEGDVAADWGTVAEANGPAPSIGTETSGDYSGNRYLEYTLSNQGGDRTRRKDLDPAPSNKITVAFDWYAGRAGAAYNNCEIKFRGTSADGAANTQYFALRASNNQNIGYYAGPQPNPYRGEAFTNGNAVSLGLPTNAWYTVSLYFDFENHLVSLAVYIRGADPSTATVVDNIPLPESARNLTSILFYASRGQNDAGSNGGNVSWTTRLDNFGIYYTNPKFMNADSAALDAILDEYEKMDLTGCSPESVARLQAAVTAGLDLYNYPETVTQAEVDAAVAAIRAGIDGLVRPKIISVNYSGFTNLVEDCAANIPVIVDAYNPNGLDIVAGLFIKGELVASAPIAGGKAVIKVAVGIVKDAADIRAWFVGDDIPAVTGKSIPIKTIAPNLWKPELIPPTLDGTATIRFAEAIELIAGAVVTVNGVPVGFSVEGNDLTINAAAAEGDVIVMKGVKYPELFPSYSFTFTVTAP